MIRLISQNDAEAHAVRAGQVQNISPYLNPAHVLAPPRGWLEAVKQGEWTWAFFRWRYKATLRQRFAEDEEAFFHLLQRSEGPQELLLACHCPSGDCHRELARDFLEVLRTQAPYRRWKARRLRSAAAQAVGQAASQALQAGVHPALHGSIANVLVAHPRAVNG